MISDAATYNYCSIACQFTSVQPVFSLIKMDRGY
jgi:hypothetical protein